MDHFNQGRDLDGPRIAEGAGSARELFALTDEQILEMEPDSGDSTASIEGVAFNGVRQQPGRGEQHQRVREETPQRGDENVLHATAATQSSAAQQNGSVANGTSAITSAGAVTKGLDAEPPRWLADMMADPQSGGEAREFWNGVAQARTDAAAYREVFAKPEAAREAAQRARVLDDIDRAYFAGDGGERSRLAASMLREDPAAFREMVIEGLRALDAAEKQSGAQSSNGSRLARAFADAGGAVSSPGESHVAGRTALANGSTGVAGAHGGAGARRARGSLCGV